MATPRTRKPRAIVAVAPEVAPEETVATPEPTAEELDTLTNEKCGQCKGLGLVRKSGSKAGKHYRTLNGAQAALANGNAMDCEKCHGYGLVAGL